MKAEFKTITGQHTNEAIRQLKKVSQGIKSKRLC